MQRWENEGGREAPSPVAQDVPAESGQERIDHATEMADRDRARSRLAGTRNDRTDLEVSAGAWRSRAALLQRIEDSFQKREALDRAAQSARNERTAAAGRDDE